jgi:uncharacterized protein (DUF927 family)
MNETETAAAALLALGTTLAKEDCFDEEDIDQWHSTTTTFKKTDERLLALQNMLPKRQQLLAQLDQQYNLTTSFPKLMEYFARKDVELHTLLQQYQRESGQF